MAEPDVLLREAPAPDNVPAPDDVPGPEVLAPEVPGPEVPGPEVPAPDDVPAPEVPATDNVPKPEVLVPDAPSTLAGPTGQRAPYMPACLPGGRSRALPTTRWRSSRSPLPPRLSRRSAPVRQPVRRLWRRHRRLYDSTAGAYTILRAKRYAVR